MTRALVIGLGKSGRGAAKLLLQKGYEVLAVDQRPQKMAGVTVYPEGTPIGNVQLVVVSPGIPKDHPLAKKEVVGEVELALRTLKNPMIGITGTNGKTTLTLLITHILNACGISARALGNVGTSIAEYACKPNPKETLVVELSSFQLETMQTRAFDFGVITNISPDHLDRYPSFEAYAKVKHHLKDLIKGGGHFVKEEEIDSYLQLKGRERYWKVIGKNCVAAAFAICSRLGVTEKAFNEALKSFKKPPHRMEFVGVINGVRWINDSKGTNSASVFYGAQQVGAPFFLIAGGRGKGEDFKEWKEKLVGKVKGIFAIGEVADKIERDLKNTFPIWQCKTLYDAVDLAKKKAVSGDTVLLSPGCASFDQFKDYAERGEKFKEYILRKER